MPENVTGNGFESVSKEVASTAEKATESLTEVSRSAVKSVATLTGVIEGLAGSLDKLVKEIGGVYGKFAVDLPLAFGKVTESFVRASTSINTLNQQLYEFATYTFTPLNKVIRETAWNINITTERFTQLYESLRKIDTTGTISIGVINSITDTLKKIYPIGDELAERVTRVAEIISRYPTLAPYVATSRPIPTEEINLLLRQYGSGIRDSLLELAAYQKAVYTRERIEYPGRRLEEIIGRFEVGLDKFYQQYGITAGRLHPLLGEIASHMPMILISLKALGFGIEKLGVGLKGKAPEEGGIAPAETVFGAAVAPWVGVTRFRRVLSVGVSDVIKETFGKSIESWRDLDKAIKDAAKTLNISDKEFKEVFPEVIHAYRRLRWGEVEVIARGGLVGTTLGFGAQAVAAGFGAPTWLQGLTGVIVGGAMGGITGGPWGAVTAVVSNAAMGIWNILQERRQRDIERRQLEEQQKQTNILLEAYKREEEITRVLSILETRLTDVKFSLEFARVQLEYMGRVGYTPGAMIGVERQMIGLERTIGEAYMRTALEQARRGWTKELMESYLKGLQMVYDAVAKEVELSKKRVDYIGQAYSLTNELASALQNEGYLLSQAPELMQAQVSLLATMINEEKAYLSTLKDVNSTEGLRVQAQIAVHTMQLNRLRFETEILQRLRDQATILEHNKNIYSSFLGMAQELHLPWSIQMGYARNIAEYTRQMYENAKAQYEAAVQNNRPIAEQMKLQEAMVSKAKEYIDAITYARRSLVEQMATGFLGIGGATRGMMPVLTPEGVYKGPAYFEGALLGTTAGRPLGLTWQDVMEKMYGTIEEQQNLFESIVTNGRESVKLTGSIDMKLDNVGTQLETNLPQVPEIVETAVGSFSDVSKNIGDWLRKIDTPGGLPVFVTNVESITKGITSEAQRGLRQKELLEEQRQFEEARRRLPTSTFDYLGPSFRMMWYDFRQELHKVGEFFRNIDREIGTRGSITSILRRTPEEEAVREKYWERVMPELPSVYTRRRPRKRLQEGGIVTKPIIALVGEAGPEAVIPLREDKVSQYLGFAKPRVNVTTKVYIGNREIRDYIYEAFIDAIRS